MKKIFLVLVLVFSVFINMKASDDRWNNTVNLIFESMKKPAQETVNLEKNINDLREIIGSDVSYQQINHFVVNVLENFIEENPSVNKLYFTNTDFALIVVGFMLYNHSVSTEWERILTPVFGALSVRIIDHSTQALINTFSHSRDYARIYTHLANFCYCLTVCLIINDEKAKNVPNFVFPMAGAFCLKVIDPILRGFDFSFTPDSIRNRYRPYLSDSIKRYYLSGVLTCFFAKRGITEPSTIKEKMKHLFLNSKDLESLKTTLINEFNLRGEPL